VFLAVVAWSSLDGLSFGWLVVVLLGAVLGADWLLPLRGVLSYGLTAAMSVLALPWAALTLRFASAAKEEQLDPRQQRLARERRLRGFVLRLTLVLMVATFLVSKWWLLLEAEGASASFASSSRSYTLGLGLIMAIGLLARDLRASRFLATASLHPARLMALSFGGVGMVGALLLALPISVRAAEHVPLVDHLFMAFSAVCVTGLSTVNIAHTYTVPGQVVLAILIQLGGLGIMVLSAAVAIAAGQRMRLKSTAVLTEVVDGTSLSTLKRTVLTICAFTFALEALGAFLLYLQWQEHPSMAQSYGHPMAGAGSVLWASIFHAISAFCNAGMSNLEAGLPPFTGHPLTLSLIGVLVALGGLGFPVLDELSRKAVAAVLRKRGPMLSLHARVVLRASGALLLIMMVAYLLLEWRASFAPLSYLERVGAAAFHAVVARSAGFNVIDLGAMVPATLLLTCAAMFIGAGPGSTGGGIKVTTLVALFAGLRAELTGRAPHVLNRGLPDLVIRKATGVAFLSMCIVLCAFFLLLLLEDHPPLELAFEAVSAFSTTGLSTGITGALSTPGKLLITFLMFAGRIGPLTLALALSAKAASRGFELPQERVLIG
jgi:trk system potassium uptake protein TrkH